MASSSRNLLLTGAPGALCAGCGSALAPDQRYCLDCGQRRSDAVPDALDALRAAATTLPVAVAAGAASNARRPAIALIAGSETSLRIACAVFALTLAIGAYAGAATTSRGPALHTARMALAAPAGIVSAPAVPATPAAPAEPTVDATAEAVEPVGPPAVADAAATTDSGPVTTDDANADDDKPVAKEPATTDDGESDVPAASTPSLDHVVVVALPPESYELRFDPAGPSPYLASELTAAGALLSRVHALRAAPLANTIALVSGQAPNADTEAGCPAAVPVMPGTIGGDDQALGRGCVYPAEAFTIADQLGGRDLAWRAYAAPTAALPATTGATPLAASAATACPAPGEPFTALRNPFLAFAGLTADAAACASHLVPADRLAADLKDAASTPSLAYVVAPAESAALDGFLRGTVSAFKASAAYASSAMLIVAEGSAGVEGSPTDTSPCCADRPWYASEAAGGGRTGALLISPFVKGGTVVDAPLDHIDLLRTISDGLGLRPLGLASHSSVTGVPREAWSAWPDAGHG